MVVEEVWNEENDETDEEWKYENAFLRRTYENKKY